MYLTQIAPLPITGFYVAEGETVQEKLGSKLCKRAPWFISIEGLAVVNI